MNRMGILIISPFFRPNIGGAEAHLDDLCEYLRTHNYMVYVLTYQPLTTKARGKAIERKENLEIRRISWFGHNWFHKLEPYILLEFLYLTPGLFFSAFFYILRHRDKIDVIYAYGMTAATVTRFLNKIFRKRMVMGTCAVYNLDKASRWKLGAVRWLLSRFNRILTLAEMSRRDLVNAGIEYEKMQVYNLWVDPSHFPEVARDECRELIGLSDRFIVLFVGRLIEIKGIRVIMEVAKEIDININFVIVGDGPLYKEIEEESRLYNNIHFIGKILAHENRLNLYYRAADLLVVPSQYEECFGKVIIEALYCGTPVIGANNGAIPDIVNSSVGRVIEPTKGNFKREIEYFYQNQGELEQLKANCKRYAVANFSSKNAEIIADSFL